MRRSALLGGGVFAASLAVLLVRFLVPRPVSMSDNGDGFRALCGAGIKWISKPEKYVHLVYEATPGGCDPTYQLSQSWLARLAVAFGARSELSLVVLGVISSVLAASAIALVVVGLPYRLRVRLLVAVGLLLVVADSAFFGYFSGTLGEGTAFLGLLLATGGLLLMGRRWLWSGAAVTVLGGLLAVNAKVQTLMVLPLLIIAVLIVTRPRWLPGVLVVVALVGGTWWAQTAVTPAAAPDGTVSARPGDDSREINVVNTVFLNIVDGHHDSAADLASLGLPASFAQYAGNGWWHPHPVTLDPQYPKYRAQLSRRNVVEWFVSHPARTLGVLNRAAGNLLEARPDYLASFDASAGLPPGAQEYRVPVWSGLAGLLAPLGLFALVPVWLFVAWRAWRHRRVALGVVLALLLTTAVGQFLLAALGDGIENVKHQVIALFCTLVAVVLGCCPARVVAPVVAPAAAKVPE
ncbi:glycan biosynthesis hexose transferase WsfD [Amycolatopsis sp. NPDC004368]